MWLFLVGLALLTGDVLSQVNKVIDSETDLLALPSDQLTHSSAELLALEDLNTGLPFGAKLPGYENPIFAYSYTVKENSPGHNANTLPTIPEHLEIQTSRNVLSLPKPNFKDSSTTTSQTGIQKNIMTNDDKDESTHKEISFPDERFNHSTRGTLPKAPLLPSAHLPLEKESPLSGISVKRIQQKPYLSGDYLPPNMDSPSKPSPEYLPPQEKDPKVPDLSREYLPPKKEISLPASLNLDYLPPDQGISAIPNIDLDYLPPKEELNLPAASLNLDYLPPDKKKSKIPNLDQEYLHPDKKQTTVANLDQEYLLPSQNNIKEPSMNQEYLPSNEKETKISNLNQEYLPPDELSSSGIDSINQDYLPPIKEFASLTKLASESTPISEKPMPLKAEYPTPSLVPLSIERTLVPPSIEYNPSTSKLAFSFGKSHIPSRLLLPSRHLKVLKNKSTFQLIRDKPQVDSAHTDIVDEPIIPVSKTNDNIHLSTISSFENKKIVPKRKINILKPIFDYSAERSPPIGAIREANIIKPDSIVEIKTEPITFSAKYNKPSPYSVVHEHKDIPIQLAAEETRPFVTIVDDRDSEIKLHGKNKIIKPVSSSTEIINEPIVPKGVHTRFTLPPIVADSRETPIIPLGIIKESAGSGAQIKPVRDKLPSLKSNLIASSQREPSYTNLQRYDPPTAAYSNQISNDPIIPQSHYTNTPLSIFYKESTKIYPTKDSSNVGRYSVYAEESKGCLSNDECQENEVCEDGKCIHGCSLAKHLCIGSARCHTRHHVPACVCPSIFTARTVNKGSGLVQFDCTPIKTMMSASSPSNTIELLRERTPPRYSTFSYQRPVVATPVAAESFDNFRPAFTSPLRVSGNPCSPSPCGPNTRCDVNNRGIALCRCIEDYIPDGNTINGCKPQCTNHNDCPNDYRCAAQKCERVCVRGACGLHADCQGNNHVAVCTCPSSYGGDPHITCRPIVPEIRVPENLPVDPCIPNPCGTNAGCRARGERPVCYCPEGYEGSPLTSCRKGECIRHNDCADHLACQRLKCIDPCSAGVCGHMSDCSVRNHQPVCSCPQNYIGDPLVSCRRITEHDMCNPTPCGDKTNCRAKTDSASGSLRAVCSCIDNYIGSPLTGCRPECTRDTDCSANQGCRNNRCRNPCVDGCGDGAYCDVANHRAVCSCPEYFLGDPHSRCYAECTAHTDCPGHKACIQFRCGDPCEGACGRGANCEVKNHTPICSCPRDYTGDPFDFCRPFTPEDLCRDNPCGTNAECKPGKDRSGNDRPVCICPEGYIGNPLLSCQLGDCRAHSDCSDDKACYGFMCQSPCYTSVGSVCGENARCNVKEHQPVCSCPTGYTGNPLQSCRIGAHARIAGRSFRKK